MATRYEQQFMRIQMKDNSSIIEGELTLPALKSRKNNKKKSIKLHLASSVPKINMSDYPSSDAAENIHLLIQRYHSNIQKQNMKMPIQIIKKKSNLLFKSRVLHQQDIATEVKQKRKQTKLRSEKKQKFVRYSDKQEQELSLYRLYLKNKRVYTIDYQTDNTISRNCLKNFFTPRSKQKLEVKNSQKLMNSINFISVERKSIGSLEKQPRRKQRMKEQKRKSRYRSSDVHLLSLSGWKSENMQDYQN